MAGVQIVAANYVSGIASTRKRVRSSSSVRQCYITVTSHTSFLHIYQSTQYPYIEDKLSSHSGIIKSFPRSLLFLSFFCTSTTSAFQQQGNTDLKHLSKETKISIISKYDTPRVGYDDGRSGHAVLYPIDLS